MKLAEVTRCPACRDGFQDNPNTGNTVPCEVCNGWGVVTPKNICACGRPCCQVVENKYITCGDPKCVDTFKEVEKAQNFRSWGGHYTGFHPSSQFAN